MSDRLQRATEPADFGRDKAGVAARWIAEWRLAEQDAAQFTKRAKEIERRYMDERPTAEKDQTKFNVFWSNIQTLKPAIYATPPKPVVQRRYLDADPVARAASTILQRAIQTNIDQTGWHEVTDQCVQDYLVVGRGTPWARYEPHFEAVSAGQVKQAEASEDGMQPAGDMGGVLNSPNIEQPNSSIEQPVVSEDGTEGPEDDGLQITNDTESEVVTYEEVCWDYVHWRDFRHSPSRVWQEVRWVGRLVLMTMDEGVERFGEMFRDVPMIWRPDGMDEQDPSYQLFTRARVVEIWDKPSRKVIWFCPDYGVSTLDEKDDFLKLPEFFPCPRPLYATLSNASLMPAADLKFYQDQARELDDLTARISNIARATKVAGVYNSAADGVQRVMNEGVENQLVPVENWGAFSDSGGFKGAVDFLPLDQMVLALKQLVEVREQTKRDLYEITGIADIVRGQGMASATATAERLKGQFAQLRLRSRVGEVARFCRDMVRITGEIIAKHFQPQTLLLLSDFQQTSGADPQVAMKAIELLKNDQTRGFRIEIEVDSTVIADQEQEQKARVEFLQMAGQFLQQAVPLAQQVPEIGVLAGQMLLFGVRGFPVGREMETVFESALEQLQQGASKPKPEPPPDPAMMKVQADAQIAQQKLQQDGQIAQAKMQQDAQIEAVKAQLEQSAQELEARKLALEEQRHMHEATMAAQDQTIKSREVGLAETAARQKADAEAIKGQMQDISAVQGALQDVGKMLQQLGQQHAQSHEAVMKGVLAKRTVQAVRGPDGRIAGATSMVEAG